MAQLVIHAFQPVHVAEQHADISAGRPCTPQFALRFLLEVGTVQQAREAVSARRALAPREQPRVFCVEPLDLVDLPGAAPFLPCKMSDSHRDEDHVRRAQHQLADFVRGTLPRREEHDGIGERI